MKRNLALLAFIFIYSCGNNKSSITQPPIIDYYIDDQTFIDELNDLNVSASENEIIAGITTVDFIDVDTGTLYSTQELESKTIILLTIRLGKLLY